MPNSTKLAGMEEEGFNPGMCDHKARTLQHLILLPLSRVFLVGKVQLQVTKNFKAYPHNHQGLQLLLVALSSSTSGFYPYGLRWLLTSSHHVHIPVSIKRKTYKKAHSPQLGMFPENCTQHFSFCPVDHMGTHSYKGSWAV